MNTDTVERIEREPRLSEQEHEDRKQLDAEWERQEWRQGCINRMCAEVRKLGVDFKREQLFQILSTIEVTLYEHGEPELASQVGDFACEVQ
jgi:hypothetical protein